jgi:chromosome segregation ATPase
MGQTQDVLKQGLDKILSASDKHRQVIDRLKQTFDQFKAGMHAQKQAVDSLREAFSPSSSPDDALQSMKDALDSLKDVLDGQKDAMDVEKDVIGVVKDAVAQLKDGLDAWSALQDKSNDDVTSLTTEIGKIKEQMIADKTEVRDQVTAEITKVQDQVTDLQVMFSKKVLNVDAQDAHDLWEKLADVAKEQIKEYLTRVRNTIINELSQEFIPGLIKDALGTDQLKQEIKTALVEDGFLETQIKSILAKQPVPG